MPGSLPSEIKRKTFLDAFGGVYESSPWIADSVWVDGVTGDHDTTAGLYRAMRKVVENADETTQLALLKAHPSLAGRLAIQGKLTAESKSEQESAGLDRCTPAEFEEFHALNVRYREKFGFPFILAVRGRNRQNVLESFRRRVENDRDAEFAEALEQVHRIALLRLEALFG